MMKSMKESKKYMLCPQCGSRRLYFKTESGEEHFVFVMAGKSIVYAKTGDPVAEDLDMSQVRCADCSWYGGLHKLTTRFMY